MIRFMLRRKLTAMLIVYLFVFTTPLQFACIVFAQSNLVTFHARNFPEGTHYPISSSPMPTADFTEAEMEIIDNIAFERMRDNEEDVALFAVFQAVLLKTGSLETSPFSLLAQQTFQRIIDTPGPNNTATAILKAVANADPFIGLEATFVNSTSEPLNISLDFAQGTLPIGIDTSLQYETYLNTEVRDTNGDGNASAASVFINHLRTLTDVSNSTDLTSTSQAVETDGSLNLTEGAPYTESSGPNNLFVSNLDVDFFDNLGVPQENRVTSMMSSLLTIEQLSPGDSIDVKFGFSIGTLDDEIPLVPAEFVVEALERDLFVTVLVPEPSSILTVSVCCALLALLREKERR